MDGIPTRPLPSANQNPYQIRDNGDSQSPHLGITRPLLSPLNDLPNDPSHLSPATAHSSDRTSSINSISSAISDLRNTSTSQIYGVHEQNGQDYESLPAPKKFKPFGFAPVQLTRLMSPNKDLDAFKNLGGLYGLEKGLKTSRKHGLDTSVNSARKRVFGSNKRKGFRWRQWLYCFWLASLNWYRIAFVVILVATAAWFTVAKSLSYELDLEDAIWAPVNFVLVFMFLIALFESVYIWRRIYKLPVPVQKEARVVRAGRLQPIDINDALVGDVMAVGRGDVLPVDGIYISGSGVVCDEYEAIGQWGLVAKTPAVETSNLRDPFLFSGSKVTDGFGYMLVTAVGVRTNASRKNPRRRRDRPPVPLVERIKRASLLNTRVIIAVALLLLITLLVKFAVRSRHSKFVIYQTLHSAAILLAAAIPDPYLWIVLNATNSALGTVRNRSWYKPIIHYGAGELPSTRETIATITSVCTGKTGILTKEQMSVVTGCIRTAGLFKDSGAEFDGTKIPGLVSTLAQSVLALWRDSIVVNSTVEPTQKIRTASNGLRIEVPLLQFAQSRLGVKSIDSGRDVRVLQVNRFNPKDKFMSTIIKHKGGHGYRLLVKGASDIILAMCSSTVNPTVGINPIDLTADDRKSLQDRIAGYGDSTLKTISFAFRDFETWPGEEIVTGGLTFLAVMGILNPVRGGSVTGVKDCKKLDLSVRMVTGDNIHTAKAVAKECGIYTDGKAMKGSDFYQLSRPDQLTVLPTLQVLAECRPKDKHVIVERLKELGETVAITGSDADDAIAVKSADVGYAPIWASEIVKEAADFEMRLDSFSYISRTFTSYRSLREAAPKILQFQIPNTIITATVIFVTSVANGNNSCLLTIFHVYWLTLGVGAIVAQALGKEPPLSPINFTLNKIAMWKMIIGQTIYQLTAILVLYAFNKSIQRKVNSNTYNYDYEEVYNTDTFVFATMLFMQMFSSLNCRRVDNKLNIFQGMRKGWRFLYLLCTLFFTRYGIFSRGKRTEGVGYRSLTAGEWVIVILLGVLVLPVGVGIRLIPDGVCARFVPRWMVRRVSSRGRGDVEAAFEMEPRGDKWWRKGLRQRKMEVSPLREGRFG